MNVNTPWKSGLKDCTSAQQNMQGITSSGMYTPLWNPRISRCSSPTEIRFIKKIQKFASYAGPCEEQCLNVRKVESRISRSCISPKARFTHDPCIPYAGLVPSCS